MVKRSFKLLLILFTSLILYLLPMLWPSYIESAEQPASLDMGGLPTVNNNSTDKIPDSARASDQAAPFYNDEVTKKENIDKTEVQDLKNDSNNVTKEGLPDAVGSSVSNIAQNKVQTIDNRNKRLPDDPFNKWLPWPVLACVIVVILFIVKHLYSRQKIKSIIKAAEHGDVKAQLFFLSKLLLGDPTKYGPKAEKWLLKAAQQDDINAQYILGCLYSAGCGVPIDTEKAIEMFKKAAGQGHEDAKKELESISNEEDSINQSKVDTFDERYEEAVALVTDLGHASVSLVQRYMKIGYNRAARIIERMEVEGVVGPSDGVKPRKLMVNKDRNCIRT